MGQLAPLQLGILTALDCPRDKRTGHKPVVGLSCTS
jgi:hypothetical protein